ncbi:MAG: hypothetical protein WCF51_06390 [Nitrosomonadaceae bacterium]
MKLFHSIIITTFMVFSGTAFASHCPADMQKIDAALEMAPKLTAAQLTEVQKLRSAGESLHKEGKHKESVETLSKAMAILGIK